MHVVRCCTRVWMSARGVVFCRGEREVARAAGGTRTEHEAPKERGKAPGWGGPKFRK